jgi:hypothetical protein
VGVGWAMVVRGRAGAAAGARVGELGRLGQRAKREATARLGEKLIFQFSIFKQISNNSFQILFLVRKWLFLKMTQK